MKPVAPPQPIYVGTTWKDHVYIGARRALKTLTYVGGIAAGVAGIAVLRGTPVGVAVTGAALVATGSAVAMGTEKTLKEHSKVKGVRWYESPELIAAIVKAIPVILTLIGSLIKGLLNGKDGENGSK